MASAWLPRLEHGCLVAKAWLPRLEHGCLVAKAWLPSLGLGCQGQSLVAKSRGEIEEARAHKDGQLE